MDVAMPVLDGVQAARLLKASQVTQGIALIAYTAKMNLTMCWIGCSGSAAKARQS